MQPLISVIIPTYNRSHLLGETLESVLKQTYENWECLVIDDGSTDDTRAIMDIYTKKDSRILYYSRPKNRRKGANSCRNYGFELSKGEYVNWFDDDDIMHPQKLELQKASLANSDYSFSVCKTSIFELKKNNVIGIRFGRQFSSFPLEDYIKMKIGWMTPSVLWKRSVLESFEYLFDENLRAAQEWEFHSRILSRYTNYLCLNEQLDFVRKHEKSISYLKAKEKERVYNYFLARWKIYSNNNLDLGEKTSNFLRKYLLNAFKMMVRTQNPYVFRAFVKFVMPEKKMTRKSKFYAFLSIISYSLTGKGNRIHQQIKYTG